MKPRPRGDTRLMRRKPAKIASLDFSQRRSASAQPEWGVEITRFKWRRRRARLKG